MIPVFQTTPTNCVSAAIASVLEIPIEDAPVLWEYTGGEWMDHLRGWALRRGLGVCYFSLRDRREWPMLDNFYCIVSGDTERSADYFHCVVALARTSDGETRLEWVHDPCDGGNFITNPDHLFFFVTSPGTAVRE
jgi:hypothetical protein